jgi:hypothetical protein
MNDEERADAPPEALRLVIPTRPHDVPAALLALSPVALVHYSDAPNPGVFVSSAFGSVEEVIDRIRSTIARQAAGRFWIFEAAQVLADAHGLIARQVLSSMVRAFEVGKLRVRKLGTGLSADPMQGMGDFVTPVDVDAWLAAEGADYRFPPAPCASASTAPAVKAPTAGAGGGVAPQQRRVHKVGTRAKPLAAVFARAKAAATDSTCPYSVWAALVA